MTSCLQVVTINYLPVGEKKKAPGFRDKDGTAGIRNNAKSMNMMRVGFEPTRIAPPGYSIKVTLT